LSADILASVFNFGPFDWVALGSIGTLAAVITALVIAIWGPQLQTLFSKPKLTVSIKMHPPDSMKMLVRGVGGQHYMESYQCRLLITNTGKREARNVEVKARHLQIVPNGGTGHEDLTFIPMNLQWAHTDGLSRAEQITAKRIEPGLDKHCNLCGMTNAAPLLNFATEVSPTPIRENVYANRKQPGNYLLDIVIAADNAKAVYKTLRINFGGWFDDEGEMFKKGLVITVL
jgi:hypothetical protein